MKTCKVCGRYFAPEGRPAFISKTSGVPIEDPAVCVSCR